MRILRQWERWWFEPQETLTISVIRVLVGVLLLCYGALMAPDLNIWFTNHGLVQVTTEYQYNGPGHFSILLWWTTPAAAWTVFGVLMLCALCVTCGCLTRVSCILAYICLLSFDHRNLVILNSGDTLLKEMLFLLCFSPCGSLVSVDSWRTRRSGRSQGSGVNGGPAGYGAPVGGWSWNNVFCANSGPVAAPWAQRLLQFQVSMVYMSTVLWKIPGSTWRNGTAMYIVNNLSEMQRFPMPGLFHTTLFVNLQTWYAVVTEFSMGFLVWFPATRLPALALGGLMHLGIEYTLNVPLFSSIILVSYLSWLNLPRLRDRFLRTGVGRQVAERLGLPAPALGFAAPVGTTLGGGFGNADRMDSARTRTNGKRTSRSPRS